jgi:hypothetical protein
MVDLGLKFELYSLEQTMKNIMDCYIVADERNFLLHIETFENEYLHSRFKDKKEIIDAKQKYDNFIDYIYKNTITWKEKILNLKKQVEIENG